MDSYSVAKMDFKMSRNKVNETVYALFFKELSVHLQCNIGALSSGSAPKSRICISLLPSQCAAPLTSVVFKVQFMRIADILCRGIIAREVLSGWSEPVQPGMICLRTPGPPMCQLSDVPHYSYQQILYSRPLPELLVAQPFQM